ncbi:MAG: hypothetical protein KatS3mg025_1414 [Bacteroidia bacterium]|nr:MAG: hypothetical protein KatS3mg025_1414 [Bacteroidia bacterium]
MQELIKSALEPVLQERLRQVSDPAKQQEALLSIRVLDPACGSGHFLLAAARRLAKELARLQTGEDEPSPEAQREAVRTVIAHCIYGVDKNPLAVELCKVALWIESHLPGKPLTFLDHRIRCGDSLVGITHPQVLGDGVPDEAFEPVAGDDKATARTLKQRNTAERSGQRGLFDPVLDTPLRQSALEVLALNAIGDDTVEAITEKASRYRDLRCLLSDMRQACNLWTAAFFQQVGKGSQEVEQAITTDVVWRALAGQPLHGQVVDQAEALAHQLHFFHWPLEFLDVFAEGGFDVVLGNPPFMGGLKIGGALGWPYRRWLEYAYAPFKGTADLCAAFYRRAFSLLKPGGRLGMVATNTIGQGDTRESGLAVILQAGGIITFARRFIKWPGVASVEVNLVAVMKKPSEQPPSKSPTHTAKTTGLSDAPQSALLDGRLVPFISSRLDDQPETEPKRLRLNEGKAFVGDTVVGIGFVLEPAEAEALLAKDPRNADCLFPYLNGEDLNSHPEQKPSRWVICFHDWPLERAQRYPDLLRIVEKRVKPQRMALPPHNPTNRKRREYWWQFGIVAQSMRQAIAPLHRVLVRALTSEMHIMTFVPKGWIYSHAVGVFAFDDDYHFALLQSVVHEVWVWRQASSLGSSNRYTPTDCFDTFPFPLEEYRRMVGGGVVCGGFAGAVSASRAGRCGVP